MGKNGNANASKRWTVELTVLRVFEGNLCPGLERDAHQ